MDRDAATCAMGMSASRHESFADRRRGSVPRRRVLVLALFGAGVIDAGVIGAYADAPKQISQAEARYQDHPRGGLSCSGCTFFRRPRSCQVVAGDISPDGWCRLFDLPD